MLFQSNLGGKASRRTTIVLASVDFTTIAVWTKSGLATCCLLFVMELTARRVQSDDDWRMMRHQELKFPLEYW
jgi:hypothetical protein